MCGRYSIFMDADIEELNAIVKQVNDKYYGAKAALMKTGEIYPTNIAPILMNNGGGLEAALSSWGFPGFNGKNSVIINARSETAGEKRMFKDSLRTRRCIVPSTGFFEWSHNPNQKKKKYLFHTSSSQLLYMGGFFREFEGESRYVILMLYHKT